LLRRKPSVVKDPITVSVIVNASLAQAWECYVTPKYIALWNHASDDWECPKAVNDLKVGGEFCYTMRAKDLSVSFDLRGQYSAAVEHRLLKYTLEDGRLVEVIFKQLENNQIEVTQTFEPETQNTLELQQSGWQAILNNYKLICEAKESSL
jgi:uncharacterized protein YndB with AHSA1/START domain